MAIREVETTPGRAPVLGYDLGARRDASGFGVYSQESTHIFTREGCRCKRNPSKKGTMSLVRSR